MDGAALAQIDDKNDNLMNNNNSDQQTVRGQNPKGDSGELREHDGLPQGGAQTAVGVLDEKQAERAKHESGDSPHQPLEMDKMAYQSGNGRGSEPGEGSSPKPGGQEPNSQAIHPQARSENGKHEAKDSDFDKKHFPSKDNLDEAIPPGDAQKSANGKVNEEEEVAALLYDMARTNSGEDTKSGKRPADPAPRSDKRSRRSTRARKPEIYNDYASDFEDLDVEADYVASRTEPRKLSKSTIPESRMVNDAEQGLRPQVAHERYFNPTRKCINQMTIAKFIEWSLNLGGQQQYIERGFMPPGTTPAIHASMPGSFAPLSPHIPGRALVNQSNMDQLQYGAYVGAMGASRYGLQGSNQMSNYGNSLDPALMNQQPQQYGSHPNAEVARVMKGLVGTHFGDRQLPNQGYGGQYGTAGAMTNAGFHPGVQHTEHSTQPPGVRIESVEASLNASKNTPAKIASALKELLAHNMGDQKDFTLGTESINRTSDLASSRRQSSERTQMEANNRHSISGFSRPLANEVAAVAISMPQGHMMEANNNESGARNSNGIHQPQESQYLDRLHSLLRNFGGNIPDYGPQNAHPGNK